MENNTNEVVETCSICYEDLTNNTHTLNCGHSYHCGCIINWFRNSHNNCPLCNDTKLDIDNLKWSVKIKTIEEIKKLDKKKDCPENIKKNLTKIKKLEKNDKKKRQELKEAKKEFDEFKETHKNIIKNYKKLETKYLNKRRYPYKNRRKIRDIENELLAQIELTPIYIKN